MGQLNSSSQGWWEGTGEEKWIKRGACTDGAVGPACGGLAVASLRAVRSAFDNSDDGRRRAIQVAGQQIF
jgi:hypothetical protein